MSEKTFVPVKSSNLAFVRFDEGEGLLIRFRNGRLYRYASASREVYDEIVNSDSPGGVFHRLVRTPGLPYEDMTQ